MCQVSIWVQRSCIRLVLALRLYYTLRNYAATYSKTGVDSCPLFPSPFGPKLEQGVTVLLLVVGGLSLGLMSGSLVPILVPSKREALILSLFLTPF